MAHGTLTVIGTPIGNLGDASPRAVAALKAATCLACEDTRRTGQLLRLLGIRVPALVSYHKDNEAQRTAELLKRLAAGEDIGLVSDSGLPGISDPGARLVAAARGVGVLVTVIPGPCAAALAVAGSGFEGEFTFAGFLPRTGKPRKEALERLSRLTAMVVFYEAPGRVGATVAEIAKLWGNRPAWLARELTKMHEEWLGPDISSIAAALADRETLKGECTLVVQGRREEDQAVTVVGEAEIRERLAQGGRTREVAEWLAAVTGVTTREAYQRVLSLREDATTQK